MLRLQTSILVLAILCSQHSAFSGDYLLPQDWPQFRGRQASGVADGPAPPTTWDVSTSSNVRWKTAIPGLGLASPIVGRGYVFIVTAVGSNEDPSLKTGLYGDIAPVPDEGVQTWELYCLSQRTGQICWKQILYQGVPAIKRHTKASHANSTPATDGRYIIVNLGSEGLYCVDYCGNIQWKRDFGVLDSGYYQVPSAQWGFASSPIIYRDMVIVQTDVQENSFLGAYNIRNGFKKWRVDRTDVPTWSTPAVFEGSERTELIINGYRHTGGYDPWTGRELWKLTGGGDIPVPTPVFGHDLIYLSSAHGPKRPLRAIRPGATGDITDMEDGEDGPFAWNHPQDGIYMQTPLVLGPHLYACRLNGVLTCYDAVTGKQQYRKRVGSGTGFTPSVVAVDDRLYITSEDGKVFVVRAGSEFELLATNSMEDICMATPAISNGMLIVRTKSHVYGIEQTGRDSQIATATFEE